MSMIIMGAIAIGGVYFLFMTKQGKELVASITGGFGNGDNGGSDPGSAFSLNDELEEYRRGVAKDPQAFIPGSARWKQIVDKNRRIQSKYSTVDDYYYE